MQKNIVFRGCTRPATFLGVPYIPFFIGAGSGLLMGMYFNLFFLLTIPFIILIMRQMAKRDDMIFRFLGLRLKFRLKARNREEFPDTWCFSPNEYRNNPPKQWQQNVRQIFFSVGQFQHKKQIKCLLLTHQSVNSYPYPLMSLQPLLKPLVEITWQHGIYPAFPS